MTYPIESDQHAVYTVVEVAQMLRIHSDVVRKAIRTGALAAENYGGASRSATYRISAAALAAWRASRTVTVPNADLDRAV